MTQNTTYLVSGATGYIGSRLVKTIVDDGKNVEVIVRPSSDRSVVDRHAVRTFVHDGSLADMMRIMSKSRADTIYHLAAHYVRNHKPDDVPELIEGNVTFGTYLLEGAAQNGVKKFVSTGTVWEKRGDNKSAPVNLYAALKAAHGCVSDYYSYHCGMNVVTVRLCGTYGPGDWRGKVLDQIDDASRSNEQLKMSPGEQKVNLLHVDDVVRALMKAESVEDRASEGRRSYSAVADESVRLRDLVKLYEHSTGRTCDVNWGARSYSEGVVMEPWLGDKTVPGWKPRIGLREGLRKVYGSG